MLLIGFNPGERDFCFSTVSAYFDDAEKYRVSIPASGIFVFLQLVIAFIDGLTLGFNPGERDFCFSTAPT